MTGVRGNLLSALALGPLEAPLTPSLLLTLGEALEITEAGLAGQ